MGNILLGRLCEPEDLTRGLIFLASNASDMVTGHILHIDDGGTAHYGTFCRSEYKFSILEET
jgi:NAD(P)-dependent dehydrogenase (short-subunit alcohol dehydrogenase family)